MKNHHTFHIPVMGIGFTIDTPLKVAPYGVDSSISLGDDILIEKLRKKLCHQFRLPYTEIPNELLDKRAMRITAYLNLLHDLVNKKIEKIINASSIKNPDLKKYFSLIPSYSSLKKEFEEISLRNISKIELSRWLRNNLSFGSIDVNVMTKADKVNYHKNEMLPKEYNDAHAAIRGFAQSQLHSSIIFSAGMNPRLYGYLENFKDFFPDVHGQIKKKVILKVSDFRSALIQGKFLAKKGIWVSEFRIESGLNCGGHAFATDGHLLGPILAQFKEKREELHSTLNELLYTSLKEKNKGIPNHPLQFRLSAQGGVGTSEEHQFLIDHYGVDSVGWGSPFLLVPEITSVDKGTLQKLRNAQEDDLYLSNISPLGVPFNNLRGTSKDHEKVRRYERGRPGSPCPKKYLALNVEFNPKGLCTASRQYQNLKTKELLKQNLPQKEFQKAYKKVIEKSCICVGLGTSALLVNDLNTKVEGEGVSICPGPNMAYFSEELHFEEMTRHIYGEQNFLGRDDRPNMFIKELSLYIDYFRNKVDDVKDSMSKNSTKILSSFSINLQNGVNYYLQLFDSSIACLNEEKSRILTDLKSNLEDIKRISSEINVGVSTDT